jgi:hypothetical protein
MSRNIITKDCVEYVTTFRKKKLPKQKYSLARAHARTQGQYDVFKQANSVGDEENKRGS